MTSSLGCGDKNSDQSQVLTCMRNKSPAAILGAYASTKASFGPIADGVTAFSDSIDRFKNGNFIKKPILLGNNDQEANLIRPTTQGQSGLILPQAVLDFFTLSLFTCPAKSAAGYRTAQNIPTW